MRRLSNTLRLSVIAVAVLVWVGAAAAQTEFKITVPGVSYYDWFGNSLSIDGAYAIVTPQDEADKVFGARPLCPGYAYIRIDAPLIDYVLAPPDRASSFAVIESPWTEPNGWYGLDLGEGWEDDAAWLTNAPTYALEDQVNAGTPDEAQDEEEADPGADHREDEERAANDNPHEDDQVEEAPEQTDRPEREGRDPVVPNNPTRPGFGF